MHAVVVVDEDRQERDIVVSWIDALGFEAHEADTADEALVRMSTTPADIVLCDVSSQTDQGIWLAAEVRERHPQTALIVATPLRDIELAISSLRNDVVDYLLKPYDRRRLQEALILARDWHAATEGLDQLQHAIEDRIRSRRAALAATLANARDTHEDAIDGLIDMLQLHERDGRGHATRVARLTVALADELGMDEQMILEMYRGALLHDIGKLDMPRAILRKPAPLDDREWEIMRTHPRVGYDLCRKLPRLADAAEIVVAHHEAFDGGGYPYGLKGDEIPLGARVLAVADAYDSMVTPHTQRPPLPPALAVEEIERCSGSQFDPDIACALADVLVHATEVRVA